MVQVSIDSTFVADFLLTYRTFLQSPAPILKKLKSEWEQGSSEQREKVSEGHMTMEGGSGLIRGRRG